MRQATSSRQLLPTDSGSDRQPHHRPYSSLAAVFPSLLISGQRSRPAMQRWPPAALLCSPKRRPRTGLSPGLPPRLTRCCVRLPRHLFVRCPFLVRCSSLRSNNGGSPIRPLFATSTVDGPAAAQSSSLRHQSFRISSLSICIGRRCSGNQETGVARPRGLFWRVRSCWARRVPTEIIKIAAGLKPLAPSTFALRLRL